MSHWDGKERRKMGSDMDQIKSDLNEVMTDVRLLVNKVDANHESLRKTITKIEELIEKHNHTLYGNGTEGLTSKVKGLENNKNETNKRFDNYNWIFGTVFLIQMGILTKLFWPH